MDRCRWDPGTVQQQYDRLAHLKSPVVEVDVTGGHRLLAQYSAERLLLLDMGGHEIVGRYDQGKLAFVSLRNERAPDPFWREHRARFSVRCPDEARPFAYMEEIRPEWLCYPGDEQQQVCDTIANAVLAGAPRLSLVLGGPGTGKTGILLNLLKDFTDLGYDVGLTASPELVSYIETSTHANISAYRVGLYDIADLDLLLVDDRTDLLATLDFIVGKPNCLAPALLTLLDRCQLTPECCSIIAPLADRGYVKVIPFDQMEGIKGLEFQHVFLFIHRALFDEMQQGFSGWA